MGETTSSQLTFKGEDPFEGTYEEFVRNIREGVFSKGLNLLSTFLDGHPEPRSWVYESMKLVAFWANRETLLKATPSGRQRTQLLQEQWRGYEAFLAEKGLPLNEVFPIIKRSIHERIMQESLLEIRHSSYTDVAALLDLAGSMRVAGQLDKAVETLRYALRLSRHHAGVLLLLSEVYAELKKDDLSQQALRELFFWNANEAVKVDDFRNPKMLDVLSFMREAGFAEKELPYWLPTYARVRGAVSATAPMHPKALERATALVKERELNSQSASEPPNLWQAILTQSYLYLVEHYVAAGEAKSSAADLLMRKIDLTNARVYGQLCESGAFDRRN